MGTQGGEPTLGRRRFLAMVGLLGAGSVAARGTAGRATGVVQLDAAGPVRDAAGTAAEALRLLATDTYRGLASWVVPGPDPYSVAQGVTDDRPGGVDAAADRFLMEGLDGLLPLPDTLVGPAARALARGVREAGGPDLPPPSPLDRTLDDALVAVLGNDGSTPVSLLVALLLNLAAVEVRPDGVAGAFPASPFASLSWDDKTAAMRILEEDHPRIAATIDGDLDEPSRQSLSGLLDYASSSIVHFTAFGAYSEFHALDPATGVATERPIGWELTDFAPGRHTPADGWDELRGYHQGMRTFAPESSR